MRDGSKEGFSVGFTGRGCFVSPLPNSGGRAGALVRVGVLEPGEGLLVGASTDGRLTGVD